eukprot:Gb_18623 [translate_table: standard]
MVYDKYENLCSPISDGLTHLLRLWLDWHTSGSVAASLILQIILLICGIYRKRSSSKVVKALEWFSYMAADAVAIYALGLMLGSACRTVYAVWAPLLLFHLGGPDNFTAYSDADTQLWLRHALTMVFQICALLHWHIATSLCEMSSDLQAATVHPDQLRSSACNVNPEVMKNNEEMSRILSRYCAYLLHCYTDLLPVNADFARMVYKTACSEIDDLARSVLAKIKAHSSDLKKRHLLEELLRQNEKKGAMGYGTKLGCQLLDMEEEKRWKVCADMWFDLLVYCALENKAMLHVKTVAEGGEFITHLWTLLGHMTIGQYNICSF